MPQKRKDDNEGDDAGDSGQRKGERSGLRSNTRRGGSAGGNSKPGGRFDRGNRGGGNRDAERVSKPTTLKAVSITLRIRTLYTHGIDAEELIDAPTIPQSNPDLETYPIAPPDTEDTPVDTYNIRKSRTTARGANFKAEVLLPQRFIIETGGGQ